MTEQNLLISTPKGLAWNVDALGEASPNQVYVALAERSLQEGTMLIPMERLGTKHAARELADNLFTRQFGLTTYSLDQLGYMVLFQLRPSLSDAGTPIKPNVGLLAAAAHEISDNGYTPQQLGFVREQRRSWAEIKKAADYVWAGAVVDFVFKKYANVALNGMRAMAMPNVVDAWIKMAEGSVYSRQVLRASDNGPVEVELSDKPSVRAM